MTPMKRNLSLLVVLALIAVVIGLYNHASANRKKPLLFGAVDASSITKISISKYGQKEVLEKRSQGWVCTAGGDYIADSSKVSELLEALINQRREDPISKNPANHIDLGVDSASSMQVVVDGTKGQLFALLIGNTAQGFTGSYIRVKDGNEVYISKSGFDRIFSSAPDFYRDKTLLRITKDQIFDFDISYQDAAQEATIGMSAHFDAEKSSWRVAGANGELLDNSKVNEYLGRVTSLTVDEWYSPSDTALGFEKPSYKFNLKKSDGSTVRMVVGNARNDKFFVKIEGDDNRYMVRKYRIEAVRPSVESLKAESNIPSAQ